MKISINIKKLAPTLSLGAATATAAPLIAMQSLGSKQSIVVNNFAGNKPLSLNTLHGDAKTIDKSGMPELKLSSVKDLMQHLQQPDRYDAWVGNEMELLRSATDNPSSDRSIKSEIFKAAKKAIQKNKRVTGRVTHEVCQKAYKMVEQSKRNENLIKDIWRYCSMKKKAVKKAR